MITLIQRVLSASVTINQQCVAKIQHGILALIGFEQSDTPALVETGFHKLIHYRVFNDAQGKMNQNVQQCHGGVLLVPQFTLVAETQKGLRPSFSKGAAPPLGAELFQCLTDIANKSTVACQFGVFGADMQVALINDGPVTFLLQHHSEPRAR